MNHRSAKTEGRMCVEKRGDLSLPKKIKRYLQKHAISVLLIGTLLFPLSACSTNSQSKHESDNAQPIFSSVPETELLEPTHTSASELSSESTLMQPETEAVTNPSPDPEPVEDESWKLLLVNADHPLPADYSVTLKELRNGHHVDERIYPELQQMFDDARAAGIYPLINESFRTAERQQEILDKYIAGYEASGMSHEQAVDQALTIVAVPGTSEHQLGLALDIIAEYDADSTATWQWLKENSWRYGFIHRYPAEKEAVTGITYEPWHFRYVGAEAAKEITERGLCLEEYVLGEPH